MICTRATQTLTWYRYAVLGRLENLLRQLVQTTGKQQGLPQAILNEAGGRIFTYGSFALGVYNPGSDMDTLALAPKHVTRDHFFQHMPDMIRKEFKPEEVTELTAVPGIAVPIIKLELCGVSVDFIFCALKLQSVPKTQELNDLNLLRGLDDVDVKCLNGTRVTNRILDLVPQTKVFKIALRAIKLWAKQRALYGNIACFPGGVAYAMMVARICQLYPKAAAPVVVAKFFFTWRRWGWPNPIFLQHREEGSLHFDEWDNSRGKARFELWPIITPIYPRQNSCHTVTPSTKTVMLKEMERAEGIVNGIRHEGRPWKELFQRHSFFTEAYGHYICIITAGKTKEASQAWSGLVESRVQRLISGIEQSDAQTVELVQPFNKGFKRVHECKNQEEVDKVLEGSMDYKVKEVKTEATGQADDVKMQAAAEMDIDGQETQPAIGTASSEKDGPQTIWTMSFYLGIGLKKGSKGSTKLEQRSAC